MDGVAGEQGHRRQEEAARGQHRHQRVTAPGLDRAVGQTPRRQALPAGSRPGGPPGPLRWHQLGVHAADGPQGVGTPQPWGCPSPVGPCPHTQGEPAPEFFGSHGEICSRIKEFKPSSSSSPVGHSTQQGQTGLCQGRALLRQKNTSPCITPSPGLLSRLHPWHPLIPLEEPPTPGPPHPRPHRCAALTGRG